MDQPTSAHAAEPLGRAAEQRVVERFLDAVSGGDAPRALALVGPAGIGKTTLWRAALEAAAARGMTVLRAAATSSEVSLAYVGLGDLLRRVDQTVLDALPAPQRRAIRVATLQEEGGGANLDARAVGAGLLALIGRLAGDGPVIVALDDARWLDDATSRAVAFALRRIEVGPVGILLTTRGSSDGTDDAEILDRLAPLWRRGTLTVGPLSVATLYQLLLTRLGRAFARPTLVRIGEWSGGNPLFALEIGRAVVEAGGLEAGAPPPAPRDLAETLAGRLRALGPDERRTLLLAASAVRPRLDLVERAAARLGWAVRLPSDHGSLDERGGMLVFGHPLIAAQALATASDEDRRRAHRALAEVVDLPEERARHLALAASGPDPLVAAALEDAARAADGRGAPEEAIDLAELALRRTADEDGDGRSRRGRVLGELLYRAGETHRAREAFTAALTAADSARERALSGASLAESVAGEDGAAAAVALCEAALTAGGDESDVRARVELAWSRVAPRTADALLHAERALALVRDGPADLRARALADVLRATSSLGLPVAPDLLDEAVRAEALAPPARVADGPSAVAAWLHLMDDRLALAHDEFSALRDRAELAGDDSSLARILVELAQIDLRAGRWNEVAVHADEAAQIADRADRPVDRALAAIQLGAVAAARGDRATAERFLGVAADYAGRPDAAFVRAIVAGNLGALALGEGDAAGAARLFAEAEREQDAAQLADSGLGRFHADRLEALVELGEVDLAAGLADEMDAAARRNDRLRPRAFVDRGRGAIAAARGDLESALAFLDRSAATLAELGMRFEEARTLLARGVVHRRRREKRLAHVDLTAALATFEELGATVWVARARAELGRIGLRPRAPLELTDTETTVARLAAAGRTNREIAAAAYLSPRTVEGVLARAYAKLGVASRAELGRVFAGDAGAPGD